METGKPTIKIGISWLTAASQPQLQISSAILMQHIGKPTYVNRDGRGFAARFSAPTGGGRVSIAAMKKNGLKAAPGYERASDARSNWLAA